jgi:hypothetical protein
MDESGPENREDEQVAKMIATGKLCCKAARDECPCLLAAQQHALDLYIQAERPKQRKMLGALALLSL